MTLLARLLTRARQPRRVLLPVQWLLVGLLTVAYVLGLTAVLLLAGVVASARLLLAPPRALLRRVVRLPRSLTR